MNYDLLSAFYHVCLPHSYMYVRAWSITNEYAYIPNTYCVKVFCETHNVLRWLHDTKSLLNVHLAVGRWRLFSHESKVRNLNYHLNCAFWIMQCTHERSNCNIWITQCTHERPNLGFSKNVWVPCQSHMHGARISCASVRTCICRAQYTGWPRMQHLRSMISRKRGTE